MPATRVWNGAGPNDLWSTGGNWVGGVAPTTGDDLVFPAGAAQLTNTFDFASSVILGRLTFSGAGYTINAQNPSLSLELSSGILSTVTTSGTANNTLNVQTRLTGPQNYVVQYPGTTLILNGAVGNNGNSLSVGGSGDLVINGTLFGAGALVKNGPGTVTLNNSLNSYGGLTTINAGTLVAGSNAALGSTAAGTIVVNGATLEIAFGIITLNEPLTLNGFGVGGGLVSSSRGAVFGTGIVNLDGPITLTSGATISATAPAMFRINGNINLGPNTLYLQSTFASSLDIYGVISGIGSVEINRPLTNGTVNLLAANTYTGETVIHAGILNLTGNGTLASTEYTLHQGLLGAQSGGVGTLQLDNTNVNLPNRVPDTAQIISNGGRLTLLGNSVAGSATSEQVGSITLNRGHSYIRTVPNTSPSSMLTLNVSNLIIPGGSPSSSVLEFTGAELGTSRNRVFFSTRPATVGNNGGIWPFAIYFYGSNDVDFATYDATAGAKPFTGYVDGLAGAGPQDTVRLLNPTEIVAANQTVNALLIRTNSAPFGTGTVTINPGTTLTLGSGGLVMVGLSGIVTPSVVPGAGAGVATLAFGDTGRVFSYGSFSTAIRTRMAGDLAVVVSGNGGGVMFDPGTAGNTYTSGTTLNSGGLNVPVTAINPLGTHPFRLFGGTFSASGLGTLSVTNPFVLDHSRVVFGGLTPMTFAGPINIIDFGVLSVGPAVTFSGSITGIGNLTKLGPGDLLLTANNSYGGSTTLLEGRLIVTQPGSLSSFTLYLVGGTLLTTVVGGLTLNVPVMLSQSNGVLGAAAAPGTSPLTFSNTVTVEGVNTLTINEDVTFSGFMTGSGGLTKTGPRMLTLAGIGSPSGATTVQAGVLRINGTQGGTPVAVRGGSLEGTGTAGSLAIHGLATSGVVIQPGNPGGTRGILTAAGANLSNGGELRLQIAGLATPGTDYDRLNLSGNTLTLGGTSRLVLDLAGLTMPGTATGVITYGSVLGNVPAFSSVSVINNPSGFAVTLDYTATGLNVIVTPSNQPPTLAQPPDLTIPSSQASVMVPLMATDPNMDPLTYSATAQSLAYVRDQTYDFFTSGDFFENFFGVGEKWVQSAAIASGWAFILPSGELIAWDGSGSATGMSLGNVGQYYHADPNRLINVPVNMPHAMLSVVGSQLTVTRTPTSTISAIVVTATVSDGMLTDSKTFTITVTATANQPPTLAPIPNQTIPASQATVMLTLMGSDPDGDSLTYSATAQSLAYVLDQQYDFFTDGNFYQDFLGLNEKWVQSAAMSNGWAYILPNGELYEWDGASSGTLRGNVGAFYWADPNRLIDVPVNQPHATISVNPVSGALTVTRMPTSTVSAIVVTATVSDGMLTDSKTFIITVTV
jgi:autotransporter-associated beta strand protein